MTPHPPPPPLSFGLLSKSLAITSLLLLPTLFGAPAQADVNETVVVELTTLAGDLNTEFATYLQSNSGATIDLVATVRISPSGDDSSRIMKKCMGEVLDREPRK